MKNSIVVVVIFVALLLSSCAPSEPLEQPSLKIDTVAEDEPTREAVYVYNEKMAVIDSMELRSEPKLLSSGYARLVGVVSGVRQVALIEIGGRGLAAVAGEMVDGYEIEKIGRESAYLRKGSIK
ncbi:hypothetical protein A3K48_05965 [candidate division WOR-1 bacterium RIFOXYA12_FULL_52_29]|uniref:Pilus assembly protein PilP n=1 Tax=candidate division WOR-1 bacterium RIFOXYC12_FULL_54_18 TaxID=1802584 RepID=A0A1F4T6Z6_UNCSA|nr:MAG: hypothetical protein A3K44_05965 [candidate division WOR-1 bacterium RIFOXYA2_FULL_51_19]OGC18078.1 MAG: hypothetical protein A3K48_05965 [candidate division WOR-1 bacterium RIFOXYA12_FULL_52_29]OGC26934.1 MAG: hypothetical protein A3K32_05960 [candidate division WOR-1 bacterium RIFOXYB2_FULL_45_9]OGC28495.1 MAG: hypothetical protein A3K49_05965 [candidate division WOR-1 bacterium RIFOXYC12_FULL_54_18]OGC31050.1 MAG: hypothetical protein A2346_06655 [candidate division WOR-1 bacterium R